jgi:hypothetical protein
MNQHAPVDAPPSGGRQRLVMIAETVRRARSGVRSDGQPEAIRVVLIPIVVPSAEEIAAGLIRFIGEPAFRVERTEGREAAMDATIRLALGG